MYESPTVGMSSLVYQAPLLPPETLLEIATHADRKEKLALRMTCHSLHNIVEERSAILLEDKRDALKFAKLACAFAAAFPHSKGLANAFCVELAFDPRHLNKATFDRLCQALLSLPCLTEFNVQFPLGSSTIWKKLMDLIPTHIIRIRLKKCFLAHEVSLAHPQELIPNWTLHKYHKLQSVSIDFSGVLFEPILTKTIDQQEEEWIKTWSADALSVERVYLNHTYDDNLEEDLVEVHGLWVGRNAYWSRESGTWLCWKTGADAIWTKDPDVLDDDFYRNPSANYSPSHGGNPVEGG